MSVMALALMLQAFFPLFDNVSNESVRLSVVNSSQHAEHFTIQTNSQDGRQIHSERIVLAPGSQSVIAGETLAGTPATAAAWIRVESSTKLFSAALLYSAAEVLAAAEGATAVSSTIHIPGVRVRSGFVELDATDTKIVMVNPSQNAVTAIVTFIDSAGAFRKAAATGLPAGGSYILRASQVLGDGNTPDITFEGRAVIESAVPIAAWQRVERPLSWSGIRGKSPEETRTTLLLAPFFVFGGQQGYQSTISLSNPTNGPVSLEVWALSNSGLPLGDRVEVTLQPGRTITSKVDELLRIPVIAVYPPPLITGSIRVRQTGFRPAPLPATLSIVRSGDQVQKESETVYWLTAPKAGTLIVPYVTASNSYFSGYAVANSNEWLPFQLPVRIEAFDANGILRERTDYTLSPGETFPALVGPGTSRGYLRVRSNWPVGVLVTLGSHDGRTLESIPIEQSVTFVQE